MTKGEAMTNDDICRCNHQRRQHHLADQQWAHTCTHCPCLFFEDRPTDDGRVVTLYRDSRGHFSRSPEVLND
jgi:hypothetical protein